MTRGEIKAYQRRHGLRADGVIGPRTRAAMRRSGHRRARFMPGPQRAAYLPQASSGSLAQTAVAYMRRMMADLPGVSVEGAAAAFGNFAHESRLNPRALGRGGDFGLPQWTGGRKRGFFNFCARHGYNRHDLNAQYAYVVQELRTQYTHALQAIMGGGNLYNKTALFERRYEVAGIRNLASRYAHAAAFYNAYRATYG